MKISLISGFTNKGDLLINLTLALSLAVVFVSCKTNIDMVNAMEDKEDKATITAKNSEILYTENGQVQLKVLAPLIKYFQNTKEPYNEFPEGITVYTFSDSMEIESELTAKYANYYDSKGLWSASNNVVAKNSKGEILNTEHLFWNQKKKIIYTDDNVKITTADGIQYGKGFLSDETFSNWEIKKPTSIYYINEKKDSIK